MSYDIKIVDPRTRETIELDEPHFLAGGTYAIGGIRELELSETYNYCDLYNKSLGRSLRDLSGLQASEVQGLCLTAAATLKHDSETDYWTPTEGNVRRSLLRIAAMCSLAPDGEVVVV